jgi:hypothetical protein
MRSAQFLAQLREKARRPYYDMWPMLTRLNLDLDSSLIQLPLPALCIRFPKDPGRNPFKFDWKGEEVTTDCVRLCCSLCLLENDPSIISPDVLADDRAKYEASGDQRYVDKARRRGKVGWDVEVTPKPFEERTTP